MSKTTIATCTYGPTGVLTKACSAGIFVYKTKYKALIQNPSPNNLFMRRPSYKTKYCMIKLEMVTINHVANPVKIGFAPASLNCWKDTCIPIPANAIAINQLDANFAYGTRKFGNNPTLVMMEATMNQMINIGTIFFH